jgi:hypothetical protein
VADHFRVRQASLVLKVPQGRNLFLDPGLRRGHLVCGGRNPLWERAKPLPFGLGRPGHSPNWLEHLLRETLLLTQLEAADHPMLRRSHRDAGLAVLLAPDVPAVLLEMGFITNLEDEALLANKESRQDFMDSVGDSIDAYFDEEIRVASR